MQTAKRASTTIRGSYVGNNPANWVDPWGLSASDGQKNNPTFGSVTKNFGIGFAQGAWGAAKNIGQFIAHPIKTVQATANGITQFGKNLYNDPRGTYNSIKNSVVGAYTTFKNADANEKARIVGNITGHVAVDVAAGAATKFAIGKVKTVANTIQHSKWKGIGSTGKIGEQALKSLGGESQVYFSTSQGARYVDQLVNGVAHESKVGYASLTKTIRKQIEKDIELLQTKQIDGATWHFF